MVNFSGKSVFSSLLGAVVTHLTEVTSLVVFAHEKRAAAVV
jgi:hypothetical protein